VIWYLPLWGSPSLPVRLLAANVAGMADEVKRSACAAARLRRGAECLF
jgi:hypothetical protein